jgi:DNA-binding CsgD family transcriptional regulator
MKAKKISFSYTGHLQNAWYANEAADIRDIDNLLAGIKQLTGPVSQSLPLFFVIDYTARQYLLMTEAMQVIAGYHPREFLESRMEKLLEVYHKDDFEIFNKKIFTANAAFLKTIPQQEHQQHLFSYNFRFMRQDKKAAHVLQRGYFITSKETSLPLYSIGTIADITNFKTDNIMVHTIEKVNIENGAEARQLIQSNYFYPDAEDSILTRREKMILQYLCDGLSSKQLADKLYISENTVVNHKQNMMQKTNTKNTVEMVAYSFRNHLV